MINFTAVQSIGGLCNVKEGLVLLVSHFGFLGCVLEGNSNKKDFGQFYYATGSQRRLVWFGFAGILLYI